MARNVARFRLQITCPSSIVCGSTLELRCDTSRGAAAPKNAAQLQGARLSETIQTAEQPAEHGDVVRVELSGGREVLLVGTAHISRESVDLVREVIERERPDCVCVELDERRYEALSQQRKWEGTDLREIIRKRQLATLLINLLLSSYQKRLGGQLGVAPGSELLEATRVAKELNIPIDLSDRDVRITLRRAWGSLSFFRKVQLAAGVFGSAFEDQEISEEELRRIRDQDVLSELMSELGRAMPEIKRVLIDERDAYLAEKIRNAPGKRIVAVVGAGHVSGMREALVSETPTDMDEITRIPPVSRLWTALGWAISAVILGSIAYIGFTKGPEAAGQNALYWFLANGVPSAIGGILALGHPLTVLTAFVAAPFTSLTPLIGAGYVTAFVQAYVYPPTVAEFHTVGDDLPVFRRWYQSRLLRVFLVFLLTGVGSMIGTWVGGLEILSNLGS